MYRSRKGITFYLASMFDAMVPKRVSVNHADIDRIVDQDMARRKNEDKFPSRRKRLRRTP